MEEDKRICFIAEKWGRTRRSQLEVFCVAKKKAISMEFSSVAWREVEKKDLIRFFSSLSLTLALSHEQSAQVVVLVKIMTFKKLLLSLRLHRTRERENANKNNNDDKMR
jgi:hypothetical protein